MNITTNNILGHEKIEKTLAGAIASGRVFPTWIFYGPFGVGKSSVAHKFAKRLLSGKVLSADSLDIDPQDQIHHLVDTRTHPDLFELDQRMNESISIDDTRALLQKIWRTPTISERRVAIIENTSAMNKNIYNSMLKTLEEPPERAVIIMICQNIGAIPKTLLSRAIKINFRPIKTELVKRALDNLGVENAGELAKISHGSVGYALRMKERGGLEIFNKLLEAFNCSLGKDNYKKVLQYVIDNNLADDFIIIKESLTIILKMYVDALIGVATNDDARIFRAILAAKKADVDGEIKKVSEIISMINKTESFMLDKNAVLVYAFEKFFNNIQFANN
jgi:DNA polymerase III delta prime subunit